MKSSVSDALHAATARSTPPPTVRTSLTALTVAVAARSAASSRASGACSSSPRKLAIKRYLLRRNHFVKSSAPSPSFRTRPCVPSKSGSRRDERRRCATWDIRAEGAKRGRSAILAGASMRALPAELLLRDARRRRLARHVLHDLPERRVVDAVVRDVPVAVALDERLDLALALAFGVRLDPVRDLEDLLLRDFRDAVLLEAV